MGDGVLLEVSVFELLSDSDRRSESCDPADSGLEFPPRLSGVILVFSTWYGLLDLFLFRGVGLSVELS